MLELLPDTQGPAIGLKIRGRLSHESYQAIMPVLEERIRGHGKIRLLLDIQSFKGWKIKAAFDDIRFAFKHQKNIERVAFVFGKEKDVWTSLVDQPFARGARGKEKIFKANEIESAWAWLKEGLSLEPLAPKPQKKQLVAEARMGASLRLLIVGAAPSAYALALLLAYRGIPSTLIVHYANNLPDFYDLSSDEAAVLKGLNLYEKLKIKGEAFKSGIRVSSASLEELLKKSIKHAPASIEKLPKNKMLVRATSSDEGLWVDFSKGKSAMYDGLILIDADQTVKPQVRLLNFRPQYGALGLQEAWSLANQLTLVDNATLSSVWATR